MAMRISSTVKGMTAAIPPRRNRVVATMADMGMGDMAGMKGMAGAKDEMKGMKCMGETNTVKMPAGDMKGMNHAQSAAKPMPDMPFISSFAPAIPFMPAMSPIPMSAIVATTRFRRGGIAAVMPFSVASVPRANPLLSIASAKMV